MYVVVQTPDPAGLSVSFYLQDADTNEVMYSVPSTHVWGFPEYDTYVYTATVSDSDIAAISGAMRWASRTDARDANQSVDVTYMMVMGPDWQWMTQDTVGDISGEAYWVYSDTEVLTGGGN